MPVPALSFRQFDTAAYRSCTPAPCITQCIHQPDSCLLLQICSLPKQSGSHGRVVVITQGAEPTVVAQNGRVNSYPVIYLPKETLVDTNGAGDAFAGGFLSHVVVGKTLHESVAAGHYTANVVLQQRGCTFPDKPSYLWDV